MKSMEKKLTSERKRHESELTAVREEFRIISRRERCSRGGSRRAETFDGEQNG